MFTQQDPVPILSLVRVTCPTNLIILYLITQIMFGEEYRS
jgi:hypothetical protein